MEPLNSLSTSVKWGETCLHFIGLLSEFDTNYSWFTVRIEETVFYFLS